MSEGLSGREIKKGDIKYSVKHPDQSMEGTGEKLLQISLVRGRK